MRTVLLVGAGAARAQYLAEGELSPYLVQRIRRGEAFPPPLDTDFIVHSYRCKNNQPHFLEFCEKLNIPFTGRGMEDIFRDIVEQVPTDGRDTDANLAWHHLLVTYAKLIAVSTNNLCLPPLSPIPVLLGTLYCGEKPELLTVLTTNQDLLIERGAVTLSDARVGRKARPPHKSWEAGVQQMFNEMYPYLVDAVKRKFFTIPGVDDSWLEPWPANFSVLKLHGSLNWWYESISKTNPMLATPTLRFLHIYVGQWLPAFQEIHDQCAMSYPLILPPISRKFRYFADLFGPLMELGRIALSECDRLVVFGYSFPPADKEMQDMVSSGLCQNARLKAAIVIDPSVLPALRLQAILGKKACVTWVRSVAEFARVAAQ